MRTTLDARVINSRPDKGGLYVEFEDGRSVFYSSGLLNATSSLAMVCNDKDEEEARERFRLTSH